MGGPFCEFLIADWDVVGFACHGSQAGCDICVRDEEATSVGMPVDGYGVMSGGLELVGAVDNSNSRSDWAENLVSSIQTVCYFLSVISVFLVAPFNGDIVN